MAPEDLQEHDHYAAHVTSSPQMQGIDDYAARCMSSHLPFILLIKMRLGMTSKALKSSHDWRSRWPEGRHKHKGDKHAYERRQMS